jgi:hypothetical protein
VYGKVQVRPSVDTQIEKRREKKLVVLPTLGWLIVYRLTRILSLLDLISSIY